MKFKLVRIVAYNIVALIEELLWIVNLILQDYPQIPINPITLLYPV